MQEAIGTINKASSAVDATDLARAKEQAELYIAKKVSDYYEEKYVNGNSVGELVEYLDDELEGGVAIGNDYWIKKISSGSASLKNSYRVASLETKIAAVGVTSIDIELWKGKTLASAVRMDALGTITGNGKLVWNGNGIGNQTGGGGSTPTTPSTASYTITYNAGEGTSSKESEILQTGATIEETATRDGYSFLGWYDEETGGKVITTMPEKDINVYAHWLTTAEDGSTIFSTEYGRIDVIWLNADNTLRDTPNPPTNNLSGMTPVKWTETSTGWENEPVETTSSDPDWYDYTAGSGTSDNTSSRWANAKNGDSYFVWIPKFAYRITYYASQSSTEPIGYYDGWGQWSALDGKLKKELDPGIKTVTSGGNKYIVHPAFCGTYVGYDNGSWKDDISGFWVAKYEMSRDGASTSSQGSGTTFKSIPNVQSARDITIGDMYNGAISYDTSKESHLMKNSEWGAVAYLTQSQYGRNGNEIDINNSISCITGNGGGSTSADRISKTSNEYNTTTGSKASTTGNIYGVYDISGGAWEYVAAFNSSDKKSYRTKYGKNGTTDTTLSNGTASTEYATKYSNATSNHSGNNIIYTYGKIGDATKEVNKGGEYVLNNTSSCNNWFGDYAPICYEDNPFILRGGANDNGNGAGIFSSYYLDGHKDTNYSFRAVLCP